MAFAQGDKVYASVATGNGQLDNQPGQIIQVLPSSMYQVLVIGLILTLAESVLKPRSS